MLVENDALPVPLDYEETKKWLRQVVDRYYTTFVWNEIGDGLKELIITGWKGNNIIIGTGSTFYDACQKLNERLERLKMLGEKEER